MNKKQKLSLLKAVTLVGVLFGANNAFACQYLPLVQNIIAGDPTGNTTVCVDIANAPGLVTGNKIVWNIDTEVTTDGLPTSAPAGLRHMWMMSMANAALIKAKGLDPKSFHIYAVIHGSAVHWALSDAWWQAQVDQDGNQLYPNGNPVKAWIEKLYAVKAKTGIDIQLEVCGVTLYGAGLTSNDVYVSTNGVDRVKVNQGAFGRFEGLHKAGYLVIQEGWEDNDSMYKLKGTMK